jgi:hypothetical protein
MGEPRAAGGLDPPYGKGLVRPPPGKVRRRSPGLAARAFRAGESMITAVGTFPRWHLPGIVAQRNLATGDIR